jgi:hypothetical protein
LITRIGFFHFVEDYGRPLCSLVRALDEHSDVSDSLIVLPEAYNNGKYYYHEPRGNPLYNGTGLLAGLSAISAELHVAFVVGVLRPPYNSAYLVDGRSAPILLCHKQSNDRSGNYTACGANCDGANPTELEGAIIATFLCMDVDFASGRVSRIDRARGIPKIICVPACMSDSYFTGDSLIYPHWYGKYVVLANSHPEGCGSFISNTKAIKCAATKRVGHLSVQKNRIVLRTLEELDAAPRL